MDRETNQISLLDVIEKVVLRAEAVESAINKASEDAKRLVAPLKMQLVSLWTRSQRGQPETSCARLAIIDVDGEEFSAFEIALPLNEHKNYRTLVKIPAVPIDRGSGTMWLVVSQQEGEDWREVARIPLEIEISDSVPPAYR